MITYYALFFILVSLTFVEIAGKKIDGLKLIVLLLVVMFSGLRFNIGDDFANYTYIYDKGAGYERVEPGFRLIVDVLNYIGCSQQMFFLIASTLSIVPILLTVNRNYPQYFYTSVATYVLSYTYFEGMNTVRQAIAMAVIFCSFCSYIKKPQLTKYILLGALATLIHLSSAVIVLVGWFIIRNSKEKMKSFKSLLILGMSFVLGYFISAFFHQLDYLSVLIGYQDYMDKFEQRGVSGGTFHLVLNFFAVLLIYFMAKKGRLFNHFELVVVRLFFYSIIIYNFFFNFFIGLRFYWYFFAFLVFVIPIVLSKINKQSRPLVFIFVMGVFALYTIVTLNGSACYNPYNYNFNLF